MHVRLGPADDARGCTVSWVTSEEPARCGECGAVVDIETIGPLIKITCPNCGKVRTIGAGTPSVSITQPTTAATALLGSACR